MNTTKRTILTALCFCLLAGSAVWAQTNNGVPAPSELNITVGEQRLKFAPTRTFVEMRLNVFNSQGELVYGAATAEAELQWPVKNNNGETLTPGLYAYALTLKYGENDERQHRGHFVVEKGQDQIWLTAENGTEISGTALNVARSGGRSIAAEGTSVKRDVNGREVVDEKGDKVTDKQKAAKSEKASLLTTTFNRLAKFDFGGIASDTINVNEDNLGNVGIGTAAPLAKLQVANGAIMPSIGNSMSAGIQFPSDPGGGSGDKAYMRYYATAGETTKLAIGVEDNFDDTLSFFQAGAERMTVFNGNVGIGTTTPQGALHVVSAAVNPLQIEMSGVAAALTAQMDNYGGGGAGGGSGFLGRAAGGTKAVPTNVALGDRLGFNVFGGYAGGAFRHVAAINAHVGTGTISAASLPSYLNFMTTPDGSVSRQERMRIDQNGDVGVGTTSPGSIFHVNGPNEIYSTGAGAGFKFGDRTNNNTQPNWSVYGLNGNFRFYNTSGGNVVAVTPTGTIFPYNNEVPNNPLGAQDLGLEQFKWRNLWLSSGVFNASDMRLKNHVATLKYGINSLMQLRPVSYSWKNSSDGKVNIGLLAQEVEKVVPEVVHRNANPDEMMSINYISLVPVLIKAVQEQQTMLVQKEAQLNKLQRRVNALERRANQRH